MTSYGTVQDYVRTVYDVSVRPLHVLIPGMLVHLPRLYPIFKSNRLDDFHDTHLAVAPPPSIFSAT